MTSGYKFGFADVSRRARAAGVRRVFSTAAGHYDLMNDAMSGGLHRLWKRQLACLAAPRADEAWLDVATGSGDIARLLAARAGSVVGVDPNSQMLAVARRRCAGAAAPIELVSASAERLPFADRSFAGLVCAFGLRNFTDLPQALAELRRVLKPGGRALALEFASPPRWLAPAHRRYLLEALPALGAALAGDADSYRYLGESILVHPSREKLAAMFADAGFKHVDWVDVGCGVATVHRAWRTL